MGRQTDEKKTYKILFPLNKYISMVKYEEINSIKIFFPTCDTKRL